jgi:undecaprenyl phosphate-alpha-L-ara4N flippase subunit ArnF
MQGFLYLVGTILFTVYGQLILKWRLKRIGFLIPESFVKKLYAY